MSTQSATLPSHLAPVRATFLLTDVQRMVGIIDELGNESAIVTFLDDFYVLCSKQVAAHGGEVIKYQGDSCFAMFPEDGVETAVSALVAIRESFTDFCRKHGVTPTGVRGAVHVGDAIVGTFGPESQRDAMGKAPSELFAMDGPGISLSEQAYRKLPSAKRGPWKKHGGKVVYLMK